MGRLKNVFGDNNTWDDSTERKAELLAEAHRTMDGEYLSALKRHFTRATGLTLKVDDETGELFAVFHNDGVREKIVPLGGTAIPPTAEAFIKVVDEHLGATHGTTETR